VRHFNLSSIKNPLNATFFFKVGLLSLGFTLLSLLWPRYDIDTIGYGAPFSYVYTFGGTRALVDCPHFLASLACNFLFFAVGWIAYVRVRPSLWVGLAGAILCPALMTAVCLVLKQEIRSALLAGKNGTELLPRLVMWQEIAMYGGAMLAVIFFGWAVVTVSQRVNSTQSTSRQRTE